MVKKIEKIKTKTRKKKFWKVILILGICFLVSIPIIIVLLIVLMCWGYFNLPGDGSNMTMSNSLDMDACTSEEKLKYFGSIDEAMEYTIGKDYDKYQKKEDILILEDDDAVTKISLYEFESNESIYINTFDKKEEEYSESVCNIIYEIKNMITRDYEVRKQEFTFKEQIALDLLSSTYVNQTSHANDGVLVPYGLTDSDEIYNLTIMGEEPTKIISIDYDGTTFYFWYFDSEMLDEALREKGNGSYTCGEFVNMMEIEVSDN